MKKTQKEAEATQAAIVQSALIAFLKMEKLFTKKPGVLQQLAYQKK